jgi:hypothetical protein
MLARRRRETAASVNRTARRRWKKSLELENNPLMKGAHARRGAQRRVGQAL